MTDVVTQWMDVLMWASVLMITGYLMGTLYEHKNQQIRELRKTYYGVLEVLRYFISNDKYTENHSYRVSVYATRIASCLNLSAEAVEDIHAAALLHDIGKLQVGKELLYKASRLTRDEYDQIKTHAAGVEMLETVGGSLQRVPPIVLAHHVPTAPAAWIPRLARPSRLRRGSSRSRMCRLLTSDRPTGSDVVVRSEGHHRARLGHRVPPEGGRRLPGCVQRRAPRAAEHRGLGGLGRLPPPQLPPVSHRA
jgi:hypothetical protein